MEIKSKRLQKWYGEWDRERETNIEMTIDNRKKEFPRLQELIDYFATTADLDEYNSQNYESYKI